MPWAGERSSPGVERTAGLKGGKGCRSLADTELSAHLLCYPPSTPRRHFAASPHTVCISLPHHVLVQVWVWTSGLFLEWSEDHKSLGCPSQWGCFSELQNTKI